MARYFTDRPFGVEIETIGLNYKIPLKKKGIVHRSKVGSLNGNDGIIIEPDNILTSSPKGVPLTKAFQDSGITLGADGLNDWSFVLDGSIKGIGGSELVSPILSGMEGLRDFYNVLMLLKDIPEIQANETCGFHVHHGVEMENYMDSQLFELLRIVSIFENYIYILLPEDRSENYYCKPLEIDLYEWFRNNRRSQTPIVQKLWYSPQNQDNPNVSRNKKYHPTRYHGLNLHSY